MRTWKYDGWTDNDWTRIEETAKDLNAIAAQFDSAVGGGGGGLTPEELGEYAERLAVYLSRIENIKQGYV